MERLIELGAQVEISERWRKRDRQRMIVLSAKTEINKRRRENWERLVEIVA